MPDEDNKIIIRNLIILVLIVLVIGLIIVFRKKIFPDFSIKNSNISIPAKSPSPSVSLSPMVTASASDNYHSEQPTTDDYRQEDEPSLNIESDEQSQEDNFAQTQSENQWETYTDQWGIISISAPKPWLVNRGEQLNSFNRDIAEYLFKGSSFNIAYNDGGDLINVLPNFNKYDSFDQLVKQTNRTYDEIFEMGGFEAMIKHGEYGDSIIAYDQNNHYSVFISIWTKDSILVEEAYDIIKTFKYSSNAIDLVEPAREIFLQRYN